MSDRINKIEKIILETDDELEGVMARLKQNEIKASAFERIRAVLEME